MSDYSWDSSFTELFNRCLARYRSGDADFSGYYTPADLAFLDSIGYRPREFFDFVEDHANGGDPTVVSAAMTASVRRDYFRTIMKGAKGGPDVTPDRLPAKDSELDGVRWLPRILVKARAKLRGELDPEIMFGCGGDRKFLREHDIAPADFLRVVWACGDDDARVLAHLRRAKS